MRMIDRISELERRYDYLMELWHAGNNAGIGDGIGEEAEPGDDNADAARSDGMEIIKEFSDGSVLATHGERVFMICDSYGPWGVDLDAAQLMSQ